METVDLESSFCSLSRQELAAWCQSVGHAAYRADQIRRWLYARRACRFEEMSDLPIELRRELSKRFSPFASQIVQRDDADDQTQKLLVRLPDSSHVECVLIREPARRTVCISTQVGCGMGCVFCASGLLGLKRNLHMGEILEQVLWLDRLLEKGVRITNVVFMGIGEPMANLKALVPALDALSQPDGMNLGARRITISTVGLPSKIRELAGVGKPFRLAVSLHAPNDRLRSDLIPVNEGIGIDEVLAAADDYFARTGRRVTYEYVLLNHINDEPTHARQLVALLAHRNALVNLIPMNPVTTLPYQRPSADRIRRFIKVLRHGGVTTTVRKRKGDNINAACGQLRLLKNAEPKSQSNLRQPPTTAASSAAQL
jgi:23S rRNA (adenine2503-C2)-methyltransferase